MCMTDLYELGGQVWQWEEETNCQFSTRPPKSLYPKNGNQPICAEFPATLPSVPFWQLVFFHFSLGKKHTFTHWHRSLPSAALSSLSALLSSLLFLLKDPLVAVRTRGWVYSAPSASQCSHHINLSNRGVCKDGELHMPIVTVHSRST